MFKLFGKRAAHAYEFTSSPGAMRKNLGFVSFEVEGLYCLTLDVNSLIRRSLTQRYRVKFLDAESKLAEAKKSVANLFAVSNFSVKAPTFA